MTIIDAPSPNWNRRPTDEPPSLIVIHGTAGRSVAGDLAWLRDQARDADGNVYDTSLSYHYLIGRDGTTYQLVEDAHRAWHAGRSSYEGQGDCNDYSLGIGLTNDGQQAYTHQQYVAAAVLCANLMHRWAIPMHRIVGHQHVSPGRKSDPWLHFEWGKLCSDICGAREAA